MRVKAGTSSLSLAAAMLAVYCTTAVASPYLIQGRVVAVADGDTILLLDADNVQHRVQIDAIDAPEPRQTFGDRSRKELRDRVFGRQVEARCYRTDSDQRDVCQLIADGADIGLDQIRAGMAWYYQRFASEQTPEARKRYSRAEELARDHRLGLWQDAAPQPPWEFRRDSSQHQR